MSIFDVFKKKKEENKAYVGAAFMYDPAGQAQHTKIAYESLAKEGYQMNAIVFRCINLIATSISALDCQLKQKASNGTGRKIDSHKALELLHNPNPQQSKSEFIAELVSFYLISGNGYCFNPNMDEDTNIKEPKRLYNLRPNDVNIIAGKSDVQAYELCNSKKRYPVNPLTGTSAVLHIKEFNPLDVFYGQSRITPAIYSTDTFNESQKWNYSLLKNGAKPSGILSAKEILTTEQYNDLLESIQTHWQGSGNNGKIPIAHSGLEFKQMSMSPMDMDFKENQIMAARYICQCFGVPPQLIGLPEAQTFSNMENAKLAFYEETVLPIAGHIYGALNRWLFNFYKEDGLSFHICLDKIPALDILRKSKAETAEKLVNSTILTPNEARDMLGYERHDSEAADQLYIAGGRVPVSFVTEDIEDSAKSEYDEVTYKMMEIFDAKAEKEINSFADSKYPDRPGYAFIKDIKDNYPEMWREVGNGGSGENRTSFTGKDAFARWSSYNDGDRSEAVINWLSRRESFVARFRNNVSNWQGMLALGMWAGVPSSGNGGEEKMKKVLNEQKKKVREVRD